MTRLLNLLKKTAVQFTTMGALSAWVLWKVRRDYEEGGELSSVASVSAWVLYLSHLGLTTYASLRPSKRLPVNREMAVVIGAATAVSGSALFADGIREFRSFEQVSGSENGQLVESGPYRYSRNPQVAGWLLALLGAAIAGRSVKALILVGFFFLVHRLYFPIEEQHLERTFGEEYRRYRSETPRFIGFPY